MFDPLTMPLWQLYAHFLVGIGSIIGVVILFWSLGSRSVQQNRRAEDVAERHDAALKRLKLEASATFETRKAVR